MSKVANPKDPKHEKHLWGRTSEYVPSKNFSYNAVEEIVTDVFSKELLHGVTGFRMVTNHSSIDNLPIKDSRFVKLNDDKTNILFAGCSITWGNGLKIGERWIDHVYADINKDNSCSGLFNVSQEGESIQSQVGYILEYCLKYGIPDIIFFNVPDFWRIPIDDAVYKVYSSKDDQYSIDSLGRFVSSNGYNSYKSLELFCKINKIKLVSISWDKVTNETLKDFDTFIYIDKDYMDQLTFMYDDGKGFSLISRDNLHPGRAPHKAWAKIILDKFSQLV